MYSSRYLKDIYKCNFVIIYLLGIEILIKICDILLVIRFICKFSSVILTGNVSTTARRCANGGC